MENIELSEIKECKIFDIKKAKFYLPHYKTDSISNTMVKSEDYWDNWSGGALAIIDKYLSENAVILDIGANVGSHTVYWALERSARKIYSFEPLLDTFNILKTNIKLNNLSDRVDIYNIGLSDEVCNGTIESYNSYNIGGTSFRKTENGESKFCPLDSIEIPEKIDLIKIDVEGAEVRVLDGAKNTIIKNKPVIVIETFNHKEEVDNFMQSISYEFADIIRPGEDYIYKYAGEHV